jgi:hypothetical protein
MAGFWSSTPSTVTGENICGYRTCSMLMPKVLFDRENSKDKNRRRCFQGYQGDIGCPTRESSRTIVFYPSSMFLGSDCARDSQSIANLFAGFFQSVYVRDDWIPDDDLPTAGVGHKMCTRTFPRLSTGCFCFTVCWSSICQFYLVGGFCVRWGLIWQVGHNVSN